MDRYSEWRKVQLSNIENFDPENFIFLTHSVSIPKKGFFKANYSKYNPYDKSQDFDVSLNPEKISYKKRISVALTTSNDYYTYGRIGYILSAPVENILCVGQAPYKLSNDDLRDSFLQDPKYVLSGIVPFHELVLEGCTIYGNVRPLAIFINLTDANDFERMQTEFELEQIKESTCNIYPVLDLTDRRKELKDSSRIFK